MIISDKYKYLFIEIPHTATTAISRELCQMYDGRKILRKHATYFEFQQVATAEEKKYFVFAGMRNPLDEAVTQYFKLKTNHKENYTNPNRLLKEGGFVSNVALKRFNFINDTDADFAAYFKKFYTLPYGNIVSLSYDQCDFVIRFEHLQDDFAKALTLAGIEPKRPLPQTNKTSGKKGDYLTYYTPEIVDQAKHVFGPFMKKWGYDCPLWRDDSISWLSQMQFQLLDRSRNFIWKYVKMSPYFYGRWFRAIR